MQNYNFTLFPQQFINMTFKSNLEFFFICFFWFFFFFFFLMVIFSSGCEIHAWYLLMLRNKYHAWIGQPDTKKQGKALELDAEQDFKNREKLRLYLSNELSNFLFSCAVSNSNVFPCALSDCSIHILHLLWSISKCHVRIT